MKPSDQNQGGGQEAALARSIAEMMGNEAQDQDGEDGKKEERMRWTFWRKAPQSMSDRVGVGGHC